MRLAVIFLFFALQLIGIAYSRFGHTRYFCWAPFDQISIYEIEASVNGRKLSPKEVRARYALEMIGRENRSIHHVFSVITQREQTYGQGDASLVRVRYQTNGKEMEEWNFSSE